MPRRRKQRWINFMPTVTYFRPQGVPLSSLEKIGLTIDELEAVRLVDLESLEQTAAAQKMKISQSTLQRILKKAHQKIAEALVLGKAIKVEGGEVNMPFGRGPGKGFGRGFGRGQGRGRMGGSFSAGPGGSCVCTNPKCKNAVLHVVGKPCYQMKCPQCGSPMVRSY